MSDSPKGWECPKCGAGVAPHVASCPSCIGELPEDDARLVQARLDGIIAGLETAAKLMEAEQRQKQRPRRRVHKEPGFLEDFLMPFTPWKWS